MEVEKTGRIIKVKPGDLVYLYPFVRNTFVWIGEENYKRAENLARGVEFEGVYEIQLTPSFILVPQYWYTDTTLRNVLGFDVKYEDIIKIENLSNFVVQKVPDDISCRIGMWIDTSYDYNRGDWLVRLWELEINLRPKIKSDKPPFYSCMFLSENIERINLKEALETVNRVQGKLYSKLSSRKNSSVVDKIHFVESSLFILLNFLYTIYTGTFSKGDPEHTFFDPFVDTLKGYGDTFEDLLLVIKELMIFTG